MSDEWLFQAKRTCPTCKGTGKPQKHERFDDRPPGGWPAVCSTCEGAKTERRTFTPAQLRELLRL
jgi:DnaJ-class molecular chaperone